MPPPEVADLREKVRRRAFLVREQSKPRDEDQEPPHLLGDKVTRGIQVVHPEGQGMAWKPRTGTCGLLPTGHGAPPRGDQHAQQRAEEHGKG
ncbi:MAG: hypothetical protein ACOC6N_01425 [archaeon]